MRFINSGCRQVLGLRGIEATHVNRAVEADGLKPYRNPKASLAAVTALSSVRCAAAGRAISDVIANSRADTPCAGKRVILFSKWDFSRFMMGRLERIDL
jgi:hypothetical protein